MKKSQHKRKCVTIRESPDDLKPIWVFRDLDEDNESPWKLSEAGKDLQKILKRLGEWEKLTWHEILLRASDKNRSCNVRKLTKRAQKRLQRLGKDQQRLLALHIDNTKVLYGFRDGASYHILWYDPDHRYGNSNCVYEPAQAHSQKLCI